MPDDTILVNASPLPDQLWSGLRVIAVAATSYALGRHLIADDTVAMLAAAGGVIWPIIAGQLKTRDSAKILAATASDPENTRVQLK